MASASAGGGGCVRQTACAGLRRRPDCHEAIPRGRLTFRIWRRARADRSPRMPRSVSNGLPRVGHPRARQLVPGRPGCGQCVGARRPQTSPRCPSGVPVEQAKRRSGLVSLSPAGRPETFSAKDRQWSPNTPPEVAGGGAAGLTRGFPRPRAQRRGVVIAHRSRCTTVHFERAMSIMLDLKSRPRAAMVLVALPAARPAGCFR
jgi:hypothetical protein